MTITRGQVSSAAVAHETTAGGGRDEVRSQAASSAPLDAIASLLDGECGMGQQFMHIAAIRREARIDLSDAEIKDLICEAIEEGWTPDATLSRLVALDDGSDGIRGVDCCPR